LSPALLSAASFSDGSSAKQIRSLRRVPANESKTVTVEANDTVHFLVRLRRIDKLLLTVRDVLVLYTIIARPGVSGIEIANKLGMPHRSGIQSNVERLKREGYIKDLREKPLKAHAAILHPTPLGLQLWNEIKP
jgi:DNA-binding MarR family transcriptional regulator